MRQVFAGLLSMFALFSYCPTPFAEPWFTGPLLAPAGHTIPRGHTNVEMYGFYTVNRGIFSRSAKLVHTPATDSLIFNPIYSHGLTDRIDIQYSVPYAFNHNFGQDSQGLGDTTANLGFQLLEQNQSLWMPDLRITLQQIIPTGRFKELNPLANGTDAIGLGSYQTGLAFNFQHLIKFSDIHYWRTRFSIGYIYADTVELNGYTSFGGNQFTVGRMSPGNLFNIDVAAEYTLTQNWVAVMEAYMAKRGSSRFVGFPGIDPTGDITRSLNQPKIHEVTLAPAMEYNFTPNLGIIGGVWFSLKDQHSPDFTSTVVAVNAYW